MKTKARTIVTLMAVCGAALSSLAAAPAQAYTFCPAPTVLNAPLPGQDPEMDAALQTLTDARNQNDVLKTQVLAGVHNSPEYTAALATLNSDQDQMDQLKAMTPYPQDKIADLATTILSDENRLTRIEQPTVDNSLELKTAALNVQAATQSLQTLQLERAAQQQECATANLQQEQAAERWHRPEPRRFERHDSRYISYHTRNWQDCR